jgi:hypothetical protein
MPIALEVKQSMISVPSTASIEAIKADIETGVIVLGTISTSPGHGTELRRPKTHTIESKH